MKIFAILIFILSSLPFFSQSYTKHTVQKGETILGLANKYKIKAEDLYKANPTLKDGLKADITINIPNGNGSGENKSTNSKTHLVQIGETLSSIAAKYNVSVSDIIKLNPSSKSVLKDGVKLNLPQSSKISNDKAISKPKKNFPDKHLIVDGDTKYSVSKKYDISIDEMDNLNPHIKDSFESGIEIRLKKGVELTMTKPVASIIASEKITSHIVGKGETLYSISQKYDVEILDLEATNPELKNGLKDGQVILIPNKKASKSLSTSFQKKDLMQSISKEKEKYLTLLLPFNLNKIENDPKKSKSEYLKSDKFLNITLDFYQGALMAIDSAKTIGLPLKHRVLDVYSTKNSSNITEVINSNTFEEGELVIGPFSNDAIEQGAKLLENKKVSFISPLSREYAQGSKNVFYSMPSENLQRLTLLSFLESKSSNIFAIIDQNKNEERQFIQTNCKSVKFVSLKDNDNINFDDLKSSLVKDQKNYILVETTRPALMMQLISILLKLRKEFDVQLAVFERNEAVEYDEIHSKNLTEFKMLYPSVISDNDSPEAQIFFNSFKRQNKVFPNQYAIRGFDVTFDSILRMFQEGNFQSTLDLKTDQLESAYRYNENHNQEVFIMQYDSNLTIKKVQ